MRSLRKGVEGIQTSPGKLPFATDSGEKVIKEVIEYVSNGALGPGTMPPSWGPLFSPWVSHLSKGCR